MEAKFNHFSEISIKSKSNSEKEGSHTYNFNFKIHGKLNKEYLMISGSYDLSIGESIGKTKDKTS